MENFNKNSLKAAVAKYGSLHTDGKAEAEVKEALLADEKGYTAEQVDEIYLNIATPAPTDDIPTQLMGAKDPEWVADVLASNEAVIASNEKVVEALNAFKAVHSETTKADKIEISSAHVEVEINPDASYVVAEGKSFRDSANFSTEYSEGQDVTSLGADRLKALLNQGLITEA